MKNKTDKPKPKRKTKTDVKRKSVCGCAFGCLDWDTHQTLALGGHTNLRDWRI